MRFVHLKVPETAIWRVRKFYEERAIPMLQETDGCLFASLLQATVDNDECVSMTLWKSREHAEAYESSGSYDQLLDESDEEMAGATEWRAELAGDPGTGVTPMYDPEVKGYPVAIVGDTSVLDDAEPQHLYLRIVAVRVEEGRFSALRSRYDELIVPALLEVQGCRAAFLVEGVEARSRALSVTLWESEEDAVRYELSGRFDELVAKVSEFFSGLYQWKIPLRSSSAERVGSDDVQVSGFHVVTGRKLGS